MAEISHGNASNNNLIAEESRSHLYGLAGSDTLTSNNYGEVLLIGGSGNDLLNMNGGNGTLVGGAGDDTFNFTYSANKKVSAVIEDIEPYVDRIVVNCEDASPQLNYTISGNNVVWTDAAGNFTLTLKGSTDAGDYFDGTANEYVWEVLEEVNDEREDYGLTPLVLSQALTDSAQLRSAELIQQFSHTRPDGSDCFTALTKSYWSTGENIAAGQDSPDDVMDAWMNSTGHRANILKESFNKLGVGYTYSGNSTYQHYWVQMFGGGLQTPDSISTSDILATPIDSGTSTSTATTPSYTANYVYTGGYQSIYNYTGAPIILGAFPTGLNFIDDDFHFYSATGELYINDVDGMIIDFRDGWGNPFIKAYAADNPGFIDGRNFSGFQYLVGSDDGSNTIIAGNDGSNLWGNRGWATDVLIGGTNGDTFFTGKSEGNDAIQNAAAADSVNLYDVSLSDITFTDESNGTLGIAFNTGSVITIQSTDFISARINLADGNSYRFNHQTKSWQGA